MNTNGLSSFDNEEARAEALNVHGYVSENESSSYQSTVDDFEEIFSHLKPKINIENHQIETILMSDEEETSEESTDDTNENLQQYPDHYFLQDNFMNYLDSYSRENENEGSTSEKIDNPTVQDIKVKRKRKKTINCATSNLLAQPSTEQEPKKLNIADLNLPSSILRESPVVDAKKIRHKQVYLKTLFEAVLECKSQKRSIIDMDLKQFKTSFLNKLKDTAHENKNNDLYIIINECKSIEAQIFHNLSSADEDIFVVKAIFEFCKKQEQYNNIDNSVIDSLTEDNKGKQHIECNGVETGLIETGKTNEALPEVKTKMDKTINENSYENKNLSSSSAALFIDRSIIKQKFLNVFGNKFWDQNKELDEKNEQYLKKTKDIEQRKKMLLNILSLDIQRKEKQNNNKITKEDIVNNLSIYKDLDYVELVIIVTFAPEKIKNFLKIEKNNVNKPTLIDRLILKKYFLIVFGSKFWVEIEGTNEKKYQFLKMLSINTPEKQELKEKVIKDILSLNHPSFVELAILATFAPENIKQFKNSQNKVENQTKNNNDTTAAAEPSIKKMENQFPVNNVENKKSKVLTNLNKNQTLQIPISKTAIRNTFIETFGALFWEETGDIEHKKQSFLNKLSQKVQKKNNRNDIIITKEDVLKTLSNYEKLSNVSLEIYKLFSEGNNKNLLKIDDKSKEDVSTKIMNQNVQNSNEKIDRRTMSQLFIQTFSKKIWEQTGDIFHKKSVFLNNLTIAVQKTDKHKNPNKAKIKITDDDIIKQLLSYKDLNDVEKGILRIFSPENSRNIQKVGENSINIIPTEKTNKKISATEKNILQTSVDRKKMSELFIQTFTKKFWLTEDIYRKKELFLRNLTKYVQKNEKHKVKITGGSIINILSNYGEITDIEQGILRVFSPENIQNYKTVAEKTKTNSTITENSTRQNLQALLDISMIRYQFIQVFSKKFWVQPKKLNERKNIFLKTLTKTIQKNTKQNDIEITQEDIIKKLSKNTNLTDVDQAILAILIETDTELINQEIILIDRITIGKIFIQVFSKRYWEQTDDIEHKKKVFLNNLSMAIRNKNKQKNIIITKEDVIKEILAYKEITHVEKWILHFFSSENRQNIQNIEDKTKPVQNGTSGSHQQTQENNIKKMEHNIPQQISTTKQIINPNQQFEDCFENRIIEEIRNNMVLALIPYDLVQNLFQSKIYDKQLVTANHSINIYKIDQFQDKENVIQWLDSSGKKYFPNCADSISDDYYNDTYYDDSYDDRIYYYNIYDYGRDFYTDYNYPKKNEKSFFGSKLLKTIVCGTVIYYAYKYFYKY